MNKRAEIMFNKVMLRNKSDILDAIDSFIEYLGTEEGVLEFGANQRRIDCIIENIELFRSRVKIADIESQEEPFWSYDVVIKGNGISLEESRYENYGFIEENGCIGFTVGECEETLDRLFIPCKYVSVKEYAEICGVNISTVHSWIRRGKLRLAKKEGVNWFIPSLYDKPERGYEQVLYYWSSCPDYLIEEFPFLPKFGCLSINRAPYGEKEFILKIYDHLSNKEDICHLNPMDCEKLELKLISEPDIGIEMKGASIMDYLDKRTFSTPYLSKESVDLDDGEEMIIGVIRNDVEGFVSFLKSEYPCEPFMEGEIDKYIVPFDFDVYGVEIEDMDENEYLYDDNHRKKIAKIKGNIIKMDIFHEYNLEAFDMMDYYEPELGCNMNELICSNQVFCDRFFGGNGKNILFIEEYQIEKEIVEGRLFDRIIRELPRIIDKKIHIPVGIIAYSIDDETDITDMELDLLIKSYERNGFGEMEDTGIMYACIE